VSSADGTAAPAVVMVQHVTKIYQRYAHPIHRLFTVLPVVRSYSHVSEFRALNDVSLSVRRGEFLAIVGPNGSGKSTLLQVIAGIVAPTQGRVVAEGRIAALLELGAGFNPEFTGRENVYLNSEILGLSRKETDRIFPDIERFAEIGDYIDRPVKEYSSGMYVRLAFSTAIHVDPEILIVDEALAVGDAIFSSRCVRRLESIKARGVTVIFVSHDLGLVKRLSDRAILMLNGKVHAEGAPADVMNRYIGLVHARERELAGEDGGGEAQLGGSFRHGDGASTITAVELTGEDGAPRRSFNGGESMIVRITARFDQPCENPMAGVLVRNRLGTDVYGTNTRVEKVTLGSFAPGETLQIDFRIACLLTRQEYTLTVATQHSDGRSQDWRDDVLSFTVVEAKDLAGVANLQAAIEWRRGDGRLSSS
jgi:lipopolysaccharide transport system ATP-binding protein